MSFLEILRYKSHFLRDFLEKWIFFDNCISFIFTRCRDHNDEYSTAGTLGPDRLELIIFVIINKKIDNHPSRLITAKSIMHYRFSSALYW